MDKVENYGTNSVLSYEKLVFIGTKQYSPLPQNTSFAKVL